MRELKVKNTGLLPDPIDPKRYEFGGISGVVHEERNTLGNWGKWSPSNESQTHKFFDDFGCVSHSLENSAEMQFGFLFESNLIRQEDIDWLKYNGYFVDGKINFDDRALVVLSGTTPGRGNSMSAVWEAARKFGLWPQGSTPYREDMTQREYYDKSDFPKNSYTVGLEFLKRFTIQYEKISVTVPNLKRAIKHAPIHVGIPICDNYNGSSVVNYCDLQPAHAVCLNNVDVAGVYNITDSYDPFLKRLAKTYNIAFAYKGVISPVVNVSGKKKEVYYFEKDLKFGNYDNDVTKLCKKLIEEDCLDSSFPPTPHYGIEVARGVRAYQNKNRITSWLEDIWYKGRFFGPKTRLYINGQNPTY